VTVGIMFRFEADFAQSLRCIPMCVRLKLDLCGIKLTLRQWSRLNVADRRWLTEHPCDSHIEASALRTSLAALIAKRTSETILYIPVEPAPEWSDGERVPAEVQAKARTVGLPILSQQQWSDLTNLQRFALIKLTREGHESANFLPAMREFGLSSKDAFAEAD
jgi:hypothetical protein